MLHRTPLGFPRWCGRSCSLCLRHGFENRRRLSQYDLLCITYIYRLTCLGRLMKSSILRKCSCRSCLLGRARWEYGHCYDPCSSSWKTPRTGCVLAVLAYWGEFGGAIGGIHAARRGRWGGFSDSPCAPADSEADMVDRHAKSGLYTGKHTFVQNKSRSLFEIVCEPRL